MKKILILTMSIITLMISSCSSQKEKMRNAIIEEIKEDVSYNIQEALKELNDSSIREIQIKYNDSNENINVNTSHSIAENGNISVDVNVDIEEESEDVIAITAIVIGTIAFFLSPILIVAVICYFIYKSKRDKNRIITAAINTGYLLPKEFFYQYSPSIKLQSGFIYIAWATGLFLFCFIIGLEGIAYLAFIPFIIGIGKIIGWYLYQRKENNKDKEVIIEEYHDDVK